MKKKQTISDNTLTILVHNVRSLSKHVNDTVSNKMNNESIGFTETQISLSDSTCKIIETLNFASINFNNNENNFLSLA